MNNEEQKKEWVAPTLTDYGSITEITKQIVKYIGPGDGLVIIANSNITIGSG